MHPSLSSVANFEMEATAPLANILLHLHSGPSLQLLQPSTVSSIKRQKQSYNKNEIRPLKSFNSGPIICRIKPTPLTPVAYKASCYPCLSLPVTPDSPRSHFPLCVSSCSPTDRTPQHTKLPCLSSLHTCSSLCPQC